MLYIIIILVYPRSVFIQVDGMAERRQLPIGHTNQEIDEAFGRIRENVRGIGANELRSRALWLLERAHRMGAFDDEEFYLILSALDTGARTPQ